MSQEIKLMERNMSGPMRDIPPKQGRHPSHAIPFIIIVVISSCFTAIVLK